MKTLFLVPSEPKVQGASTLKTLLCWIGVPSRLLNKFQASPPKPNHAPSPRRPLRVVRVMEAGQPSAQIGRILISGSFIDVCAELDRMAERESNLRLNS